MFTGAQGEGHGIEISMVAVRRLVRIPEDRARCRAECATESLPCRFRRARQEVLRGCAPLHRSAIPVATSAETTAADLRRRRLHLPIQTSQGSPCRAASSQRDRHDVAAMEWRGAPQLPRSSRRRQVELRRVRYATGSGVNADRRLCVRSISASVNSRSGRIRRTRLAKSSAGTAGLQ